MKKKLIEVYADHAAATPFVPEAARAMRMAEKVFGNPSAIHARGVAAAALLSAARKKTAEAIGAHADEIIFVSGGTEANNLALSGVAAAAIKAGKKGAIIVPSAAHPSLIEAANHAPLPSAIIACDEKGFMDLSLLKTALAKNPVLLSFAYANGEIGTIERVREIMKIVRAHRKEKKTQFPYVHLDASQAAHVLPLSVVPLGVDLMTIDGAKIGGPKGAGALFVRRGVRVEPLIRGGGQERGLRAGTENLPGAAAFAEALLIAQKYQARESKRLGAIRASFVKEALSAFPNAIMNGADEKYSHPGIVSICFPGAEAEQAVIILDSVGVQASSSSACRTLAERDASLAEKDSCAYSSIRFSFGSLSKAGDGKAIVRALMRAIPEATGKRLKLS